MSTDAEGLKIATKRPGFAFFRFTIYFFKAAYEEKTESRRFVVRFQCRGCRIIFEMPDDKVGPGKALKVLCPKCKEPAEINEKPDSPEPDGNSSPQSRRADNDINQVLDYANAIDVVDEGVKTALLCDTNLKRAEKIAQGLQELDFWVVHALRPAFALGKLHHNNYDLIVLEENFNSARQSENLVLHHVQVLPMPVRRQFYLCLLSNEKPTLDSKLAFSLGVNLILNVADLEKVKVLFARAIKEYKNFYGLFLAELSRKR
jgi:hypothetical protein